MSVWERVVRGTRDDAAGVVEEEAAAAAEDELRRVDRRADRLPSLQEASAAAAAAAVAAVAGGAPVEAPVEAPDEEAAPGAAVVAASPEGIGTVAAAASAPAPAAASLSFGSSALQLGQALCFSSHLRMPGQQSSPSGGLLRLPEDDDGDELSPRWNQCLQPGSCVTTWPSLKSSRQMVHVRSEPGAKQSEMHVRCSRAAAIRVGFARPVSPSSFASSSSAVFNASTNSDFSIKPAYFTPCKVRRRLISDIFKLSIGSFNAFFLTKEGEEEDDDREEELPLPLGRSTSPSGSKKKCGNWSIVALAVELSVG